MKKVYSVVWQFFDRLEENKRCVAVLCKLCDSEIKYFGNTTNLRTHLTRKHPLQWEFLQKNPDSEQKLVDQPTVLSYEDEGPSSSKRKKNDSKVDLSGQSDNELETLEDQTTLNLVRQMHENQESDEEWLEEDYVQFESYKPQKKKTFANIKRELESPPPGCSTLITQTPKQCFEPKKDEYSVFGEYIANKIRKFKSQRTRGNIQQIITTVLWQAEYGVYDDPAAVRKVLLQCNEIEPQIAQVNISIPPSDCYSGDKNVEGINQSVEASRDSLIS